jgi:hypothetical protein
MKPRTVVLTLAAAALLLQTSRTGAQATNPLYLGQQAAAGTASLTVTSGIPSKPGVPNPLGGGAAVLLKGGAAPDLKHPQGVARMKSRAAAEGRTDDSGRVTFSGLAPGEYYVVLIALKLTPPFTFGTPVLVKPGSNTAAIEQRHVGMGMALTPQERATLAGILRAAGGYETCKPTDILTNPDCINRAAEQQKLEAVCPVKYTGPPRKPGPANASLSVIGTGYVYNYTERDRKTGVVTSEREVERGNFINTTLYLLDMDAEEVLAEAGVSPGLMGELLPGVAGTRIMSFDMLDVEDVVFPSPGTRKELNCVMDGIKSHAVATLTTDANARGTFPNVPAGTYYVFGRFYRGGKRPAGGMFWNYPVQLKPGRNVLQLSVDKAALK